MRENLPRLMLYSKDQFRVDKTLDQIAKAERLLKR